ncbi:hypothetical protein QAD02_017409 [Eretmocerus hayati]|uniref:Uncharacterized protein n=1 Tax=Eretmocerus hayati TaxID=131215 RepID=A0ACC2PDS4_9HYME|nr:hypothetical protein QAD02_017409 [Eretmocerus hayati]
MCAAGPRALGLFRDALHLRGTAPKRRSPKPPGRAHIQQKPLETTLLCARDSAVWSLFAAPDFAVLPRSARFVIMLTSVVASAQRHSAVQSFYPVYPLQPPTLRCACGLFIPRNILLLNFSCLLSAVKVPSCDVALCASLFNELVNDDKANHES